MCVLHSIQLHRPQDTRVASCPQMPSSFVIRGSIKEQLVITSNCFLKPTASDRADLCSVNGGILVGPLTLEHSEMRTAFEKGPREKKIHYMSISTLGKVSSVWLLVGGGVPLYFSCLNSLISKNHDVFAAKVSLGLILSFYST